MAALREIASECADDLREEITWVLVWKTGQSWNAQPVWLEDDEIFEPEDRELAHEILKQDPNAIMLNGYYCNFFDEGMKVTELAAGIRWHYNKGSFLLADSDAWPDEPDGTDTDNAHPTTDSDALPDEPDSTDADNSHPLADSDALPDEPDNTDTDNFCRADIPGAWEYQVKTAWQKKEKKLKKPLITPMPPTKLLTMPPFDDTDASTSLTEEEIRFFEDTIAKIKRVIPVPIPIKIMDYETLPERYHDTIGTCWAERDEKGKLVPFCITIDAFFVHSCFFARDDPNKTLFDDTLEEVIIHEIAHLCY